MQHPPTFSYEKRYWQAGVHLIAGIDEVGMGALAGPVCAAAVIFSSSESTNSKAQSTNIRDSKTLSYKQREKAAVWIREHALAWAAGEASVEEIFELNILQAARLAMLRAVEQLTSTPEVLIVDGRGENLHPTIPSESIVKGDRKSFTIAAASIVAKVHRDNLMVELGKQHPEYGFENHKGYGAKQHLDALNTHGALACHRAAYAPIRAVLPAG